jgi:hypothetical protein
MIALTRIIPSDGASFAYSNNFSRYLSGTVIRSAMARLVWMATSNGPASGSVTDPIPGNRIPVSSPRGPSGFSGDGIQSYQSRCRTRPTAAFPALRWSARIRSCGVSTGAAVGGRNRARAAEEFRLSSIFTGMGPVRAYSARGRRRNRPQPQTAFAR